jgi:CheY-like chemotaxis protein/DNA-binding Xre family transcriptional regulator
VSLIVCGCLWYDLRNQMAMIDLKVLLGATIKEQRSTLGISQEELAYRAGLHRTYISDIERGARNISIKSIEKLAGALAVSVSSLFERAGDDGHTRQPVEILLVEDNPRDLRLTLRSFAKAKITNPVHVVRDGEEALDFLFATGTYTHRSNAGSPHIILLNLHLPKKSGIEVLQQIKANETTRDIPVVVLTASQRERDMAECRRLGAITNIGKPVRFEKFSEVTARLSLAWTLVKPKADSSVAA